MNNHLISGLLIFIIRHQHSIPRDHLKALPHITRDKTKTKVNYKVVFA